MGHNEKRVEDRTSSNNTFTPNQRSKKYEEHLENPEAQTIGNVEK